MKNWFFLLPLLTAFLLLNCTQQPAENTEAQAETPDTVMALELANRFFNEVINQKKVEVLNEILDDSFRNHSFPTPAGSNKAEFIQAFKDLTAAFPDIKVNVHDQLGEGNRVFSYLTVTGTHKGTFNGLAATNKEVKFDAMDIWREKNGKLVENWVVMDMLGMMTQIGAVPPPPAPAEQ